MFNDVHYKCELFHLQNPVNTVPELSFLNLVIYEKTKGSPHDLTIGIP
jgi:hypothetical protein